MSKCYVIYIINYRNNKIFKSIETKLNAQNAELMQRAKVIEELKTSLAIFIDKYNKLKSDFEKEKQNGIQIAMSLNGGSHRHKKLKLPFRNLKITHFSGYYPKLIKRKLNTENEFKELQETNQKLINDKQQIENEFNIKIQSLQNELNSNNVLLTQYKNDIDKNSNHIKSLQNDIKTKTMLISQYKNENEKLKSEYTNANDNYNKEINKLKLENESLLKQITEYKNNLNIITKVKNEIEIKNAQLINNEQSNMKLISSLQNEISSLKEQSLQLQSQTKHEHDTLLSQISSLQQQQQQLTHLTHFDPTTLQLILHQTQFNVVGTNTLSLKLKAKDNECALRIEKLKQEYTLKLKQVTDKLTSLKSSTKDKNKIHKEQLESVKNQIIKMYEQYNVFLLQYDKKVYDKLNTMTIKINKMKGNIQHLNINKGKNDQQLKMLIAKLENENDKLILKITNLETIIKEKDKKIFLYQKTITDKDKLIIQMENEYRIKYAHFVELEATNKELINKVEMYIIENNGKSKVIEERNEEIKKLKQMLHN